MNYCYKLSCIKWTHGLFGNIYENVRLFKSYLTVVTGIIIQSLQSIGSLIFLNYRKEQNVTYGQTYGCTGQNLKDDTNWIHNL